MKGPKSTLEGYYKYKLGAMPTNCGHCPQLARGVGEND